jgi:histidine ammonia-lyase
MVAAFNADFLPRIPEQGTVGASGDLAPLAHLALGLLGEGESWDHECQDYRPSSEVMAKLKLTPILLQEKEGLAMINGTQFITALLSDALIKAKRLLTRYEQLVAFGFETTGQDKSVFEEDYLALLQGEHREVARRVGALLKENS